MDEEQHGGAAPAVEPEPQVEPQDLLLQVWQTIDVTGAGRLGREEVQAILRHMQKSDIAADARVDKAMRHVSGAGGEITFAVFERWFLDQPAELQLQLHKAADKLETAVRPEAFKRITLEEIDPNIYVAGTEHLWKPQGARGLFGGQIMGQALAAASRTVDTDTSGKALHSMHAYFLRAGKDTTPIVYSVIRVRDGRAFSTRIVNARQRGKVIFTLTASFQRPEPSRLSHQASMPRVPGAETLPTEEQRMTATLADPAIPEDVKIILRARTNSAMSNPVDVRYVTKFSESLWMGRGYSPYDTFRIVMWMKAKAKLPDDVNLHRSILGYFSDMALLSTARGQASYKDVAMMASLDHAMWFHAPFRADEWLLYEMESPRGASARGLAFGRVFDEQGTLVVTVAQEGLIRLNGDLDEEDEDESATPPPNAKL